MKDYKQLLQAISKRVKTVDKVLAASRKHMNEFAGINFCAVPDKGGLSYGRDTLLTVTEQWHYPKVTYCYKTNSTITRPDYMWKHTEGFWDFKSWTLDFYKTDMKDGKHRPLAIWYGVGETRCNYTFIYTKKEFDRAQWSNRKFPIALRQYQLGTKSVRNDSDTDWVDTPRILGDEIDLMKDDDVMFITAEGWDQEAIFEIKYFTTRMIEEGKSDIDRGEWHSNESFAEDIVNTLIQLDTSSSSLTSRY